MARLLIFWAMFFSFHSSLAGSDAVATIDPCVGEARIEVRSIKRPKDGGSAMVSLKLTERSGDKRFVMTSLSFGRSWSESAGSPYNRVPLSEVEAGQEGALSAYFHSIRDEGELWLGCLMGEGETECNLQVRVTDVVSEVQVGEAREYSLFVEIPPLEEELWLAAEGSRICIARMKEFRLQVPTWAGVPVEADVPGWSKKEARYFEWASGSNETDFYFPLTYESVVRKYLDPSVILLAVFGIVVSFIMQSAFLAKFPLSKEIGWLLLIICIVLSLVLMFVLGYLRHQPHLIACTVGGAVGLLLALNRPFFDAAKEVREVV